MAPMTQRTRCMAVTVARAGLSLVQGQRDGRRGAAAIAGRELDVAAPAAHQLAGDGEAEAGPGRAGAAAAAAVEALEDVLDLVRVEDVDRAWAGDERDAAAAVVERVLDQRVERAVEVGGGAGDAWRGSAGDGGDVLEAAGGAAGGVGEVD